MPVDELFANECLAIHNEYRSKHGASQLTLNNDVRISMGLKFIKSINQIICYQD